MLGTGFPHVQGTEKTFGKLKFYSTAALLQTAESYQPALLQPPYLRS